MDNKDNPANFGNINPNWQKFDKQPTITESSIPDFTKTPPAPVPLDQDNIGIFNNNNNQNETIENDPPNNSSIGDLLSKIFNNNLQP